MDSKIESNANMLKREFTTKERDEVETMRAELKSSWSKVIEPILCSEEFSECTSALTWLRYLLEENVPKGKHNRALSVALFYRELVPKRTPEQDAETYILGWCLEILQTASLIADDMMDGSETRRGESCWYRREGVGLSAINDCFFLENLVYEVLYQHFRTKKYYHNLIRLVQKTAFRTILGQNLDTRVGIDKNIADFNEIFYSTIVKYKTSFYSFCAPIQVSLLIAGISDDEILREVEELMFKYGKYFQIQDDYLDCYGDPEVMGKIGTDIIDGKCSWLFVQAMKIASEDEAKILMENYGIQNCENEAKVKEIYKLLELSKVYSDYEYEAYGDIMDSIRALPKCIPKKPFRQILKTIYKRTK